MNMLERLSYFMRQQELLINYKGRKLNLVLALLFAPDKKESQEISAAMNTLI